MVGRLITVVLVAAGILWVATSPEAHVFAKSDKVDVQIEEKMIPDPSPKLEAATEPLAQPEQVVTEVVVEQPKMGPKTSEQIIWDRLIEHGFTREQTAGIAGNLKQEHNYKTDDVPGGLGIAQWMGARRANLMAKPNYSDLVVQVDFIVEELRGVEGRAMRMLQAATTVESATIAFQDGYERCGDCRQSQRIQYAYEILARY